MKMKFLSKGKSFYCFTPPTWLYMLVMYRQPQ